MSIDVAEDAILVFLLERERLHGIHEELNANQVSALTRRLAVNVLQPGNWDDGEVAAYRDWYLQSRHPYITGTQREGLTPFNLFYWCGPHCANLYEQQQHRTEQERKLVRDDDDLGF